MRDVEPRLMVKNMMMASIKVAMKMAEKANSKIEENQMVEVNEEEEMIEEAKAEETFKQNK